MADKERRLLHEDPTALEALLLRSAMDEPPLEPAARGRAIERVKRAAQAAVAVGASFLGIRWLLTGWGTLSKGLMIVGLGAVVTAGVMRWQTARGKTASHETARAMSSSASAPPSVRAAPASAVEDAWSPIAPLASSAGLRAEPRTPPTGLREERSASRVAGSGMAPLGRGAGALSAGGDSPAARIAPAESPREPESVVDTESNSTPSATGSSAPRARSLREETTLLEIARHQMGSQPAQALLTLRQYDQRYPHGVLGEDAAVLRIKGHIAAGDVLAAGEAVRALERQYPTSSYLPLARALIEKK